MSPRARQARQADTLAQRLHDAKLDYFDACDAAEHHDTPENDARKERAGRRYFTMADAPTA